MPKFLTTIIALLLITGCDQSPSSQTEFVAPPLPDFSQYNDVQEKKQAFFDYLLPLITEANNRVANERLLVQRWANNDKLSSTEKKTILALLSKYRIKVRTTKEQKALLLHRVDTIPPSLILAQAANESAWGTSRFAREGNNLFGQWCFSKGCGIVPDARDDSANHEVRRFKSTFRSVQSYILNLNRHTRYRELRLIRQRSFESHGTFTGLELANGLTGYSERGQEYVDEIRHMIRYNQLDQYDTPSTSDTKSDQARTGG